MPLPPTNHLFFRPATFETSASSGRCETKPSIQFGVGNHFSVVQNLSGYSSIRRLLKSACPLAVIGCVVAIIVNAFNTEPWWSITHVSNKVSKRVSPPVTHPNPSTTVILVVSGDRILTSIYDAAPYSVKRVSGGFHPIDELGTSFAKNLPIATTAGCGVSLTQVSKSRGYLLTAVTGANHGSRFLGTNPLPLPNYNKSGETGSFFNVEFNWHGESVCQTGTRSTTI